MPGNGFEDHFSVLAKEYARSRPGYPPELFDFIAACAPGRGLAWDVGTGSGQAAVGLAEHFDRVIATDASEQQIANAAAHPRVEYGVSPSERVPIGSGCVDVVTAAAAVHWFDLSPFYAEVHRVLRPRGVIAVWSYREPTVGPEIDPVVLRYQNDLLGEHWSPKIRYISDGYATLPFPFEDVPAPAFTGTARWRLGQLLSFLGTWSARRTYSQVHGVDPLTLVEPDLRRVWGNPEQVRDIRWPLLLRVGRVGG